MKKIIVLVTSIMIIMISCLSSTSQAYCNEHINTRQKSEAMKRIETYANKDIPRIISNIQLLAKNSLGVKKNNTSESLESYIKEADFYLSEINYVINNLRKDYDTYKEDEDAENGFLDLGMIAINLRFSMSQLKNYLKSTTLEEEYKFLKGYYIIMENAERNLSQLKSYFPIN